MKTIALRLLISFSVSLSFSFVAQAKTKAPAWEPMLEQDGTKIAKFEENAPNGQHNKYNFLVKFTSTGGKETQQALIKDLQEDWLESHSEYSFNDDVLKITVNGVDGIDKGNGVTEQKPFKLEKCFKLNSVRTNFAAVKCVP